MMMITRDKEDRMGIPTQIHIEEEKAEDVVEGDLIVIDLQRSIVCSQLLSL